MIKVLLFVASLLTLTNAHLFGSISRCQDEKRNNTMPFYRQIPSFLGKALPQDPTTHTLTGLNGNCRRVINIFTRFRYLDKAHSQLQADITLEMKHASAYRPLCSENMQISTAFTDYFDFFYKAGSHKVSLKFTKLRDVIDIHKSGLRFFTYCADNQEILASYLMTGLLWTGGHGSTKYLPVFGSRPTVFQQTGNQGFFTEYTGWTLQDRVIDWVSVDPAEMGTGDILVSRRFVGLETELMILSGGMASHVSMIVREPEDSSLWVYSAQNDHFFSSEKRGLQKVRYEDWLDDAHEAQFDVAWLPLSNSFRDENMTFSNDPNLTAFHAWYDSLVDNSSYSLVQELFAAIDTSEESYPAPITYEYVPLMLRNLKNWLPYDRERDHDEFIEALGKRFQSVFSLQNGKEISAHQLPLTLQDMIVYTAVDLDMVIQDLLQQPELDDWRYNAHQGNQSFTSSSFVVSALRQLGVFTDKATKKTVRLNAAEFTPKDVYQLDIYNKTYDRPAQCREADTYLPYCQLMGLVRLQLPGFSRVTPYDYMNERCPNTFESGVHRPPNC